MSGIGTEPIAERARALLEPLVVREGFELVDVEWLREGPTWVLRIYVDREGGVTIDHCQELSRTVETVLDVEDFIEPAYSLEVSSPGLDRPLRKPADFTRFVGQKVKVKTFGPIDGPTGPRKQWSGVLRGFTEGHVEVEADGVVHRIPHERIAKAHIDYDFEADLHPPHSKTGRKD